LHSQADNEQAKLQHMIETASNDDAAEAESAWTQAQQQIMARTVTTRFKKELRSPAR
jgi:hypothetical protein